MVVSKRLCGGGPQDFSVSPWVGLGWDWVWGGWGLGLDNIKTWKVVLSVQLSDLDVYAAWIYATIPNILFPIAPFV